MKPTDQVPITVVRFLGINALVGLLIVGSLCFVLSAFGVEPDEFSLTALGLALFALGHLFDGRLPGLDRTGR